MIPAQPGLKSLVRRSLWNFVNTGRDRFLYSAIVLTSSFVRKDHQCVENILINEFITNLKKLEEIESQMKQRIWRTSDEKLELLSRKENLQLRLSTNIPELLSIVEPVWEKLEIVKEKLTEEEFKFGFYG